MQKFIYEVKHDDRTLWICELCGEILNFLSHSDIFMINEYRNSIFFDLSIDNHTSDHVNACKMNIRRNK